jgi:MFS family permease
LAARRNLLLGFCIAMIGLASFGLSLAWSFPALLVFMALSGLGGGGFHPQSLAILTAKYRDKRAFALGVHDSSANLGEVVGPLALGFLLGFVDWRAALQIWAIPGLMIGLLYAFLGDEGDVAVKRPKDYGSSVWKGVVANKTVCALVIVSTLRAMGQTALAAFLPLFLSLHLKLNAAAVGAYMSILFLFAGAAPAFVGWISDRVGHRPLIVVFSFLSVATILAIPYAGTGVFLALGLGALGALLWALRPVIITAAISAAPQQLSGSIVAFIFGANMSMSFLAPVAAGLVADAYGLTAALLSIAVFPLLASLVALMILRAPAEGD